MILNSFSVERFRQYMHRQEIRFAFDKEHKRNITLINGVNGTGKTSLFAAINWCLFGFEVIRTVSSIDVESEKDLFCKEAISRAAPGDQLLMTATLTFTHNGDHYEVKRSKEALKGANGDIVLKKGDRFVVKKRCLDGQTVILSNDSQNQFGPEREIKKVLPMEASRYFFFDGELIDTITRPGSKQIANAINNIFKVNNLVEINRSIKRLIGRYEHRMQVIDESDKEIRSIILEKEKLENELEEIDRRYQQVSESIRDAEEYINRIEREINDDRAEKINEHIKYCEGVISANRKEIGQFAKFVQSNILDAYSILATPFLRKARLSLESMSIKPAIPGYALQGLARDLLAQLCCICGRPFEEGGPEYQRLRMLLEKSASDDHTEKGASLSAEFFSLEQSSREKLRHLESWRQRYIDLRDTIVSETLKLEELRDQFEAIGGASVVTWRKKWGEVTEQYHAFKRELDQLSELREKKKLEIRDREHKIKSLENSKSADLVYQKYGIAINLKEVIEENIQKYREKVQIDIGRKTSEIFQSLLWKKEQFKGVSLDEGFNFKVIDCYDKPALQDLSSGERQILSLAFIVAMSRLSGEEAPLMMDTPFGRLDSENRANITEHLPELADQLILLVTDEEAHDQARARLEPHIGREYSLNFDRHTGCTTIVEVQR